MATHRNTSEGVTANVHAFDTTLDYQHIQDHGLVMVNVFGLEFHNQAKILSYECKDWEGGL